VRAALDGAMLDGLVNNAGIALAGPLLHQPIAEWRRVIETNLVGVMQVTQIMAPLLMAGRHAPGASSTSARSAAKSAGQC
jgi:NAD(P)-dependent dehydrogenase (short-subunit alcohol dehydrogenase family)